MKSLFTALVRSHLGYCSQVWAPQSVIRNIKLIESVQRRATKFICKTSTDLTYRDRFIFLHLLPLNYWLEYLDLVFFYKCKANHVRIDLDNYINFCSGHIRRAATGLYLKQNVIPRTSTFRDSFFQRIVNMWNVLPVEIKMAKSISSFKEKLKSVLFFRLNNIFNQDNLALTNLSAPSAVAQTFILCVLVNFHSIFFYVSFACFLIVLNLGCNCGEGCLFYSGWVSGTKTL